tara:strand:- start:1139 stop:1366 length:228 start_codon:yes stop_codon:yes gene_type:complete
LQALTKYKFWLNFYNNKIKGEKMNANKLRNVAIKKEIIELAQEIGHLTERPVDSVVSYAVRRLWNDIKDGRIETL